MPGKGETSRCENRDVPDVTGCGGEQGSNVMGDKGTEGVECLNWIGESPSHVCKSTGITELYTYYGVNFMACGLGFSKAANEKNQYHCMCLKVAISKTH